MCGVLDRISQTNCLDSCGHLLSVSYETWNSYDVKDFVFILFVSDVLEMLFNG